MASELRARGTSVVYANEGRVEFNRWTGRVVDVMRVGVFCKYGVSKKSFFKLNETRFYFKNLSFSLFYAIN